MKDERKERSVNGSILKQYKSCRYSYEITKIVTNKIN